LFSIFLLLPVVGASQIAAAALVGQNLGAGKPERAERTVWIAGGAAAVLLGSVGLFFVLSSDTLVAIFTTDPEISAYGSDCLRIVGYGYAFYGLAIVTESAFNGAGDTWTPTYINAIVLWLFEIPLAYLLATYLGMGPQGVFWAITISFTIWTLVAAIMFRRGKWKLKVV
jgi:Na+-driven multidrug efflux pump